MPENRGEAVKVLPGRDARTRVVIVRRPDKHYAVRPEIWHERVLHDGVAGCHPSRGLAWKPL